MEDFNCTGEVVVSGIQGAVSVSIDEVYGIRRRKGYVRAISIQDVVLLQGSVRVISIHKVVAVGDHQDLERLPHLTDFLHLGGDAEVPAQARSQFVRIDVPRGAVKVPVRLLQCVF